VGEIAEPEAGLGPAGRGMAEEEPTGVELGVEEKTHRMEKLRRLRDGGGF